MKDFCSNDMFTKIETKNWAEVVICNVRGTTNQVKTTYVLLACF